MVIASKTVSQATTERRQSLTGSLITQCVEHVIHFVIHAQVTGNCLSIAGKELILIISLFYITADWDG